MPVDQQAAARMRRFVDPELLPALDALPPFEVPDAHDLPEFRAQGRALEQPLEAYARADVEIAERLVPGPAGAPEVRVVLYRPRAALQPLPVYLFIHGGGYIFGRPESSGLSCVELAAAAGCLVVSVDYRLAPETKAPGAVEDCYAALLWLNGAADELGIDAGRIAIGGLSAGGGLAAALALVARDRGIVRPCFQQLIYPMLDDRTVTHGPRNPNVGAYVWTPELNAFGWSALLAGAPGADDTSAYAAAARAADLRGLPPAYVVVGALDLFLEENIEYARRLLQAGVPTELHVVPGAYHAFELFAPEASVSKRFIRERNAAVARAFTAAG